MGARPLLGERTSVTVARGLTELDCIVPAWEELARAALEPNPFYEHWMLRPAIEAFGGAQDVRVVLVWSGERLDGLFPFAHLPHYRRLPASALVSWQHSHTLLCTPLVRAHAARSCLEALFDWLEVPLVQFRFIPAAEPFYRSLVEVLGARGVDLIVNRSYSRGLLRRQRATVSARFRQRLAKSERKGGLSVVTLRPDEDIGRWIDDFLRIEASGWKGRNGSAMASKPANERYFREIIAAAFRRGQLIACGLDAGGRAIARRFSFTAGAASYAFKTTYDEAFAEHSPGALLELANVRQFDGDPRLEWMDAFTEANVLAVERLWPDRREIRTVLAGVGAWGRLATAALPWLRWLKGRLQS